MKRKGRWRRRKETKNYKQNRNINNNNNSGNNNNNGNNNKGFNLVVGHLPMESGSQCRRRKGGGGIGKGRKEECEIGKEGRNRVCVRRREASLIYMREGDPGFLF